MKLNNTQRYFIADKLIDSVNMTLGALIFGSLMLSDIHYLLLLLGLIVFFVGRYTAIQLTQKEQNAIPSKS